MNITDLPEDNQGTKDWLVERLGIFTASTIGDLMVAGRAKGDVFGETAKTLIRSKKFERRILPEVIASPIAFDEWLDADSPKSKAIDWGHKYEPYAREEYSRKYGRTVYQCGLVVPDKDVPFGSSPDGVIADDSGAIIGCIEIKCPGKDAFMKYEEATDAEGLKKAKAQYYWQCMAHMAVLGADWCDFIAFHPFIVDGFHCIRIQRDDAAIQEMRTRIALASTFFN